jgi:hypothetical protein
MLVFRGVSGRLDQRVEVGVAGVAERVDHVRVGLDVEHRAVAHAPRGVDDGEAAVVQSRGVRVAQRVERDVAAAEHASDLRLEGLPGPLVERGGGGVADDRLIVVRAPGL